MKAESPASETIEISSLFRSSAMFKCILQTEAAECGLACIAMLAYYHGKKYDLNTLRQRYSISTRGMTLQQIIDICHNLDISSRAIKVDLSNVSKLNLPCILHWGLDHFVILKKIKNDKYTIYDPAVGKRILNKIDFGKKFTGVALEGWPTKDFEKENNSSKLRLSSLWSSIRGLKRSLATLIFLSLTLQLFALLSPYYLQIVVDDVVLREDENLLAILVIGFSLLLFMQAFTSAVRSIINLNFVTNFSIQISSNIFHHLIRLPLSYFEKRHIGDIISRFSSNNQIRLLLTNGLISAVIDGLMALITLVVLFAYSVKITIFVICVLFVYVIIRILFYYPFRRLNEEAIHSEAQLSTHFFETISLIQTIKTLQSESKRQTQWKNKLIGHTNKTVDIAKWEVNFGIINLLLFGIENLVIVYLCAIAVMDKAFTIGMLYAYLGYKTHFLGSVNRLISFLFAYKMLDIHLNRLADIVLNKRDVKFIDDNKKSIKFEQAPFDIDVRGLSYRYSSTERYLFSDLNFKINEGESIAICGSSGCGKSTLLKIMMGLFEPAEGKVTISDNDIREIDNYRDIISSVMQDDQLFSGSIAENIASFDQTLDFEKIEHCSRLANIHEDIQKMQMGYHTLSGSMGANLSGGQKQRILIARALYRSPKILFMDEATSHLDHENERIICQNIKNLDITRIFVAHRKETLRTADRIIDIDQLIKIG